MRVRRLLRMGLPEVADRSRQEGAKRLERALAWRAGRGPLPPVFPRLGRDPASASARACAGRGDHGTAARLLHDAFRERVAVRFFEGAASAGVPALLSERMPEWRDQIVAAAERVSEGRFDLLGYRDLRFGEPLDWSLDPVSGRRSPRVHWSRIDPLDAALVGDAKVVWELNRHQWMVSLAQAYRLTGAERYAETLARAIEEWIGANPPGIGINWTSSLEISLRLVAWSWALALCGGARAVSPALFARVLSAVAAQAAHVERYLSRYTSPNTHLTGEALGLFYAGAVFPELAAAPRWRDLAARILVEQSERQILADGVYFEQATCYQQYTAEIYLHFLILAGRIGWPVPRSVTERVLRLLDFLVAIRHPDGSVPQIGDADGGWILPLARRSPDDPRGLLAVAGAFFDRADYAWAAAGPAPETAWLLGETAWEAAARRRPAPPDSAPSRLFEAGGYAIMRDAWRSDAHQLIFDCGPLGCPFTGGHGHADLLSIQCAAFGTPYVVDAGAYRYAADPRWRAYFRSTHAHSSVVVDGQSQAVPAGPFSWADRPRARLRRWRSGPEHDVAEAEHEAYRRLPDPVTHRRLVVFLKPLGWVVADELSGEAEHRVELRFQLAPLEVSLDPDLWTRVRGAGSRGLLVRAFAPVPLKRDLLEGEIEPPAGWISPVYGQRRSAPMLVYSTVARLPLRVVTLLVPAEDVASTPALSVRLEGLATTIELGDGRAVRLSDLVEREAGPRSG